MLLLAWRGIRHNPGRFLATIVAIMLGTAFYSATGFVSDRVISTLENDAARQYEAVDLRVTRAGEGMQESGDPRAGSNSGIGDETTSALAELPDIDAVSGVLTDPVRIAGSDGSSAEIVGRLWISDEELNPVAIDSGRAPAASGEVALDAGSLEKLGFAVGDTVALGTRTGLNQATVVGSTKFGSSNALDGNGTLSVHATDAGLWLSDGLIRYDEVHVRSDTLDQAELSEAAAQVLGGEYATELGDEFVALQRKEIGTIGKIIKQALQAFAGLALFVGAFVIYNTFSVVVAQRVRELAVLRAIGATPRQVKRALRFEGLVIGLLGSALGVVAGLGLALILDFVLKRFNVELPGSGLKVTAFTVISALAIGTLVTVLSVMMPARAAARTEPIEALRESAVEPPSFSWLRLILVSVFGAIGLAGLLQGNKSWTVGLGLVGVFVAVVVAGPILATGFGKLLAPVMRMLGLEGRLALDNTTRNPARTATTANALLIGVFLVTLISVAGQNVRDALVALLQEPEAADYSIGSLGSVLDDELLSSLSNIEGVDSVVAFSRAAVDVNDFPSTISTGDLDQLAWVSTLNLREGSFDDLEPGTAVTGFAESVGDTVTISGVSGADERTLRVVGILEIDDDSSKVGTFVHADTYGEIVGNDDVTMAFVEAVKPPPEALKDNIQAAVSGRPDLTLEEGNSSGGIVGTALDFVVNAVNGLLLMSVLVAVIGIVNTMSLSVFERRRELGLLRAIGMVDRRVQRMVRLESILISALGTLVGMLLGLFGGWALIRALNRSEVVHINFALPYPRLLLIVGLGFTLGLAASILPARRSTSLDVLDAIAAS
ncbi:MAG: ABC transporter permease [Acidimicrobiales bacterium]